MTLEELTAIEQRLLGERRPIDIGDKVKIEDFLFNVRAEGIVTKRDGEAIWLDTHEKQFWLVDAHRDEPTPNEDIRALLDEIKRLTPSVCPRCNGEVIPARTDRNFRHCATCGYCPE